MKQITTYTFTQPINTLNNDTLAKHAYRKLGKLEHQLVSTTPLYDDIYFQDVEGYQVSNLVFEKRKEPNQEAVVEEVESRIEALGLQDNLSEETLAKIEEEVYLDLKQFAGTTKKVVKVVVSNKHNLLLVEANAKLSDEVLPFVLDLVGSVGLSAKVFDAVDMESMLTQWVFDERKCLPDQFMLVEKVNLGVKSELDKSPKPANIKVSKEYPADAEVLNWIKVGKVVKAVELEYDGAYVFTVDHKFAVTGGKFVEAFSFEGDEDSAPSVNFMSKELLQLPVLFDMMTLLVEQVENV